MTMMITYDYGNNDNNNNNDNNYNNINDKISL